MRDRFQLFRFESGGRNSSQQKQKIKLMFTFYTVLIEIESNKFRDSISNL